MKAQPIQRINCSLITQPSEHDTVLYLAAQGAPSNSILVWGKKKKCKKNKERVDLSRGPFQAFTFFLALNLAWFVILKR